MHLEAKIGTPSTVVTASQRDWRVSTGEGDEDNSTPSDFALWLLFWDLFGSQEKALETAEDAKTFKILDITKNIFKLVLSWWLR